ncbi:hypothetical protein [Opitutus terrae]|uniref:hypothetical protein n=1 Tax=Opitutus terrae TaxID=107709 RepID=UPI00030EAEE4|nr:hypothetical protein [Opitutus terrae]
MFCFLAALATVSADPLSHRVEIDFFRDVPSRNLKGLAARSDGRLVAGPVLSELAGAAPADLLWSLSPTNDPAKWLVGTGPDGKIFEITIDAAKATFSAREIAKLDEPHVFALARLPDGALLAGTSPTGALCLVREGKPVARVALPVDSIFDLLLVDNWTALVATGNPARLYRVDLRKFAAAGVAADKLAEAKLLAERGITLFGEIRDRNIRRIAQLADGRIAVGSSPKGNLYAFARDGGAPIILQENREAEVTDLLPTPDGGLYAALTFSGGNNEARITPPKNPPKEPNESPIFTPLANDRFGGRGAVVWLPDNGFPETIVSRGNTAFYRMVRHGDVLLITGGEQGEIVGYDLPHRMSLTYAGSVSSQLNALAPLAGAPGRFLVMRNNAPGFALLDFSQAAPREAETRRIDLGAPSLLGALRFNRLRGLTDAQVGVALKTSNGSDEIEGWSQWTPLTAAEQGWNAPALRGRYVKLRVQVPANSAPALELDRAALYALPQNRRPQLQDFRVLSANFGLVPMPEPPPQTLISIGQLLQTGKQDDDKRKNAFLGSQIVPTPGAQVVLWTVTDPDNDAIVCTFSLRRDGEEKWIDVVRNTREPYAQFDTAHMPDGVYFTRLIATETDPRPADARLTTTFETDDLVIDHTPPQILAASAQRKGEMFEIRVEGRDALSLLDGIEAVFNHGVREQTEQPVDGILDSRSETFVLELPLARVAGATSVEVTLYDVFGNTTAQRLSW